MFWAPMSLYLLQTVSFTIILWHYDEWIYVTGIIHVLSTCGIWEDARDARWKWKCPESDGSRTCRGVLGPPLGIQQGGARWQGDDDYQ